MSGGYFSGRSLQPKTQPHRAGSLRGCSRHLLGREVPDSGRPRLGGGQLKTPGGHTSCHGAKGAHSWSIAPSGGCPLIKETVGWPLSYGQPTEQCRRLLSLTLYVACGKLSLLLASLKRNPEQDTPTTDPPDSWLEGPERWLLHSRSPAN